jgi:hypothetical protein
MTVHSILPQGFDELGDPVDPEVRCERYEA